jgi:putative ABC transport system substrate-binding protein
MLLSRHTKRREFITLLGGATAAWPLGARAQPTAKLPTIGFLGTAAASAWAPWTAAFVQRLRELGWVEGRTVAIQYRWAEGRAERLAEFAAEFVRLKVASLNRPGGNVTGIAWLALKLEAKRLGLLHELLPQAMPVGVLLNPSFQPAEGQLSDLREAARTIGLPLHVLRASSKRYGASRDASVCSAGE